MPLASKEIKEEAKEIAESKCDDNKDAEILSEIFNIVFERDNASESDLVNLVESEINARVEGEE